MGAGLQECSVIVIEVIAEQLRPGLGSDSPAGPWRAGSPRITGSEGLSPRRAREGSLFLGRDPLNGPGPRGDKAGISPGSAHFDHNKGGLCEVLDMVV